MQAEAYLEVRDDRVATLRSDAPLVLVPQQRFGRHITVYVMMSAGGPLDGDDYLLRVSVAEGHTVVLRTVAATVALSGVSAMRLEADVEGTLSWLPEPTIVTRLAQHTATTTVRLGADGHVRARDTVVLGRLGESPGRVTTGLDVTRCGRPILRHSVELPGPPVVAQTRVVTSYFDSEGDPSRASVGPGHRATMALATEGTLSFALTDNLLEAT